MGKVKYLTKSRFKLAAECPTKLYYSAKPEYKNLKNEDSFLATLAEGGFQVGELAKTFYPSGVEIKEINHDEAVQKTTELLERNDIVIFEAAIRHKNLFVRVDVLVKCGSEVRLIEVKAKSYDSKCKNFFGKTPEDLESGIRPYVEDVAFQTYVLKKAFPHFTVKPRLMLPDKQVVVSVDGLNQLFQIERGEHGTKITVNPAIKGLKIDPLLLPEVNVDKEVDELYENKDDIAELVIENINLNREIKSLKIQTQPQAEKPISTRERNTLLTIIAALTNDAKIDIFKTSKSGELISRMTQQLGALVDGETIASKLKQIPDALERRSKQ